MPSVNKVFILGNLGQEPEIRYTKAGSSVVNLSVATTDSWVNQKGDRNEKTEWHRCVAFDRQADLIMEYCKKGTTVHIEGSLQNSDWVNDKGEQRSKTEVKIFRLQWLHHYKTHEDHQPEGSSQPAAATDEKPF